MEQKRGLKKAETQLDQAQGIIADMQAKLDVLRDAMLAAEDNREFAPAAVDIAKTYTGLLTAMLDDLEVGCENASFALADAQREPEAAEVEGKQDIASRLLPAIQLTRAGDNVQDIVIDRSGDLAEIHYATGTVMPVSISCDSGAQMIIDVCKALM